ISGCAG
ncbi:host specificity protein J, partial [Escherichia coli FRIK2001]